VRVTIGLRGIQEGQVEIKLRGESETERVSATDAVAVIRKKVTDLYDSTK
jgi:prolyl-tRNA synthetase